MRKGFDALTITPLETREMKHAMKTMNSTAAKKNVALVAVAEPSKGLSVRSAVRAGLTFQKITIENPISSTS